ncbi:hypothetical protein GCM10010313_23940 [Streptomyces violarus]|nr:hypothetical protein GCM10010313_23940 [Streptomyces violarus]
MHLARMLYEVGQQPELQVGEVGLASVQLGDTARRIAANTTASRSRPARCEPRASHTTAGGADRRGASGWSAPTRATVARGSDTEFMNLQ